MNKCDYSKPWYHGSPFKLTVLRRGSTITQDCDLARIFSHKPTIVSISVHKSVSDDGVEQITEDIKHDGRTSGFLYLIAEDIQPSDIYPHPRSSMEEGKEWVTARELRVELIGTTRIVEQERLTEEEIVRLKESAQLRRKTRLSNERTE